MDDWTELVEEVLPEGTTKYFTLRKIVKTSAEERMIILEERCSLPTLSEQYSQSRVRFKGYKKEKVEDFPIRGKKIRLELRRRVYKVEGHKGLVKRDIEVTQQGTRLVKDFAFFFES